MPASSSDLMLIDPTPRRLRIMLSLCALCAVASGLAIGARASETIPTDDSILSIISVLAAFLFGVAASIALTLFLLTLSSARRMAVIYARLRSGDALADWQFEPREWADWQAAERRQDTSTALSILVGFAVILGMVAWVGYSAWEDATSAERSGIVLVAASTIAVVGVIFGAIRWFNRHKTTMMRDRPRVIVLDGAIYCGGILYCWGWHMVALRSVRIVPGTPTVLEVTTGASAGLRAASTTMTLLALFSGRAGVQTPDTTFRIPVPSSRSDEAQQLVRRLM